MDGPILVIDRDGTLPLGVQLVEGLRRGILGGVLRAGDHVPSTRALAAELGVSRSAVVTAYEQLAGEGYLEMRQGAPTRVAELTRRAEPSDRRASGLDAAVRTAPAASAARGRHRPRTLELRDRSIARCPPGRRRFRIIRPSTSPASRPSRGWT